MTQGVDFKIILANRIGQGGFGEVNQGCFVTPGITSRMHVAVKKAVRKLLCSVAMMMMMMFDVEKSFSCLS